MIVLLDTDVLIDVALGREPHVEASGGLIDTLERRPGNTFIAWHTVSNFYYLVAPVRGGADAAALIEDLTSFVDVAPTSTADLRYAVRLGLADFEDAMQVAAAAACGAEVIATRNVRDYEGSPIPARTPAELVS
ncbi:MAG: PIN domain-containing protein [Gemmatimonadota bacterium]|nr:PIN domain-containing protein [Gemmatimonadota bacterium]